MGFRLLAFRIASVALQKGQALPMAPGFAGRGANRKMLNMAIHADA